jgi:hypothetical protein
MYSGSCLRHSADSAKVHRHSYYVLGQYLAGFSQQWANLKSECCELEVGDRLGVRGTAEAALKSFAF